MSADESVSASVSLNPGGLAGFVSRILYATGHRMFRILYAVVWRCTVHGREHVPAAGPVLLACNHASFADPPLVGSSLDRPLYFMAKEELFRIPLFGAVLRGVHAFPVRRSRGDVGAFRTAQRLLAAGGALILFPEGRRRRDGVLGPPKAGVGWLAIQSGAPVVPVYVHNTHRMARFPSVAVRFGPPLAVNPGEPADAFAQRVMAAIAGLQETVKHGREN
ncbi:MAG: 1-acyl-sn-glycerol-3-phosphate acyltransferase [Elusimicrobia bacterium]|nr:1-acyl-sn-glycerol-3-phosphate acyltransferase [Elusimicrobiota bacterium]